MHGRTRRRTSRDAAAYKPPIQRPYTTSATFGCRVLKVKRGEVYVLLHIYIYGSPLTRLMASSAEPEPPAAAAVTDILLYYIRSERKLIAGTAGAIILYGAARARVV